MNAEASTGLLHSSERVTEQTMPLWLTDLPQWPTRDHDDAVLDARRALRMRGTASIPVLQRVLDGLRHSRPTDARSAESNPSPAPINPSTSSRVASVPTCIDRCLAAGRHHWCPIDDLGSNGSRTGSRRESVLSQGVQEPRSR